MELNVNKMLSALLAIGIMVFILATIVGFFPISQLKDYTYSTATNSTYRVVNVSDNQTQYVYLGTLASISGETPIETLIVTVNNTNTTDATIGLYINGVLHSNLIATNSTTTNSTRDVYGYLVAGTNNITFKTTVAYGKSVNVTATYWTYPSGTYNTEGGQGSTFDIFTSGTMQVVAILIALIIVIAAMAMYYASQGGFKGDKRK